MIVPLLPRKSDNTTPIAVWLDSEPFVQNDRGKLIHRPMRVSIHRLSRWGDHMAVQYYCNGQATGKTNFQFMSDVPEGKFVCHQCEARAQMAGLPSASDICGRHIHTGKTIVVQTCCNPEEAK